MLRNVEVVVISDVHLGTYGCQAKELLNYLKSISPKKLIINGDFIDIWQFKKSYFPKNHLKVIKKVIDLASKGTEVVYILGNHDEFLRRFANAHFGNIELTNKKILNLDGKKAWIFHGDVFDASVQHSKWIAKLGG
jgi:UDP-2,3-diacylglucosamine pyrophosphatase LpxH